MAISNTKTHLFTQPHTHTKLIFAASNHIQWHRRCVSDLERIHSASLQFELTKQKARTHRHTHFEIKDSKLYNLLDVFGRFRCCIMCEIPLRKKIPVLLVETTSYCILFTYYVFLCLLLHFPYTFSVDIPL